MKRSTILFAAAFLLMTCAFAAACPMCKDSIPNSDAQAATSLPGGFNYSVYTLLLGMFGALALVVRTLVKGIRG